MSDVADIAKGLSEAQRRWLLDEAVMCRNVPGALSQWHTFPPPSTAKVLGDLGLWRRTGVITETGLAVRNHLAALSHEEG